MHTSRALGEHTRQGERLVAYASVTCLQSAARAVLQQTPARNCPGWELPCQHCNPLNQQASILSQSLEAFGLVTAH